MQKNTLPSNLCTNKMKKLELDKAGKNDIMRKSDNKEIGKGVELWRASISMPDVRKS